MALCKHGHDKDIVGRTTQGRCAECSRIHARSWHHKYPERSSAKGKAYRARTVEARRAQRRKWDAKNKDKLRGYVRKRAGVLDLPEKEAEPGHICELCGVAIAEKPVLDHDHSTGRVRGWIHRQCNIGLHHVEKPGFVEKAQAYLARSKI